MVNTVANDAATTRVNKREYGSLTVYPEFPLGSPLDPPAKKRIQQIIYTSKTSKNLVFVKFWFCSYIIIHFFFFLKVLFVLVPEGVEGDPGEPDGVVAEMFIFDRENKLKTRKISSCKRLLSQYKLFFIKNVVSQSFSGPTMR